MSKQLVWLVDSSPRPDVPGRHNVGRRSEPARYTGETRLRWTIAFVDASTDRTRPTGVARVYKNHRYNSQPCLVLDKGPELEEQPVMQSCTLPTTGRYPVADARQVFESNPASGALRCGHDCLADDVVDMALKAPLLAAEFARLPFGRARAFPLGFHRRCASMRRFCSTVAPV